MDNYTSIPPANFGINTDDDPFEPPDTEEVIEGMNEYFDDAYILVEEQTDNYDDTFDWHRNINWAYKPDTVDVPGNSGYWTVCVQWAYEEALKVGEGCGETCDEPHQMVRGDWDPEAEGISPGAYFYYGHVGNDEENIPGDSCVIYCEIMREGVYSYPRGVSHEVMAETQIHQNLD